MKLLAIFAALAKLAPITLGLIKVAQDALPPESRGAQRAALVRDLIEEVMLADGNPDLTIDDVWPYLRRTITNQVDALRERGDLPPKAPVAAAKG